MSSNYLFTYLYLGISRIFTCKGRNRSIFVFPSVDWSFRGMARQVNPGARSHWRELAESTVRRTNIDPGNAFTNDKEHGESVRSLTRGLNKFGGY